MRMEEMESQNIFYYDRLWEIFLFWGLCVSIHKRTHIEVSENIW